MILLLQNGVPGVNDAASLVREFGTSDGLLIFLVAVMTLLLAWLIYDIRRASNKQTANGEKAVLLLELIVQRLLPRNDGG
jgi:hypothetical protein